MNEANEKDKTRRYRTIADISALVEDFERCALSRELWTHPAYLTVIFWYLHKYDLREARRRLRDSLKRYDFEHNVTARSPGAYSEMLTVFWLAAINNYLKKRKGNYSFVSLANNLINHFADQNLPLKIYRLKGASSAMAKTIPLQPNKSIKSIEFTGVTG